MQSLLVPTDVRWREAHARARIRSEVESSSRRRDRRRPKNERKDIEAVAAVLEGLRLHGVIEVSRSGVSRIRGSAGATA